MAVSILKPSEGSCSLEFDPADAPAVKAMIAKLYRRSASEDALACSAVRFGGEHFTFRNAWDDPCPIAGTPAGPSMLERLAARPNGETAAFS